MSNFVFSNTTTVYFGKDKMCNLSHELSRRGKNVMFVIGRYSIRKNGIYDDVLSLLDMKSFNIETFEGIEPDPEHTKINEGIRLCRVQGSDVIVAIGGGSVIDSAKGIAATVFSDTDDVWDIVERRSRIRNAIPIIAIPTTASTGSEMNAGTVINNNIIGKKQGFGDPSLQPVCAFYNPRYTCSLPPYQTACGCADIISHIFDSAYFNKSGQMYMLESIQEQVIVTILKYAPIALDQSDNIEARENLMWASAWALNGFMYENLKQDAVCHAIAHQLATRYHVAHGHIIAIVMSHWLRYILSEQTAPLIRRFGIRCLNIEPSNNVFLDAEKTIDLFDIFLFDALGLERQLHILNTSNEINQEIAKAICGDSFIRSVKDLYPNDVKKILDMCFN